MEYLFSSPANGCLPFHFSLQQIQLNQRALQQDSVVSGPLAHGQLLSNNSTSRFSKKITRVGSDVVG